MERVREVAVPTGVNNGQPQACPSLTQSPFRERGPVRSPSLPRAQRMVTGLALPSVPNWTSTPPCQQYSEESEAVRIPSSCSVSQEALCESWQVMVYRMGLAGPLCVSLVAQKVTASRTVETPRGNCWCCRACPWVWRQHRPVQGLPTAAGVLSGDGTNSRPRSPAAGISQVPAQPGSPSANFLGGG